MIRHVVFGQIASFTTARVLFVVRPKPETMVRIVEAHLTNATQTTVEQWDIGIARGAYGSPTSSATVYKTLFDEGPSPARMVLQADALIDVATPGSRVAGSSVYRRSPNNRLGYRVEPYRDGTEVTLVGGKTEDTASEVLVIELYTALLNATVMNVEIIVDEFGVAN